MNVAAPSRMPARTEAPHAPRPVRLAFHGLALELDVSGAAYETASRTLLVADLHFGKAAAVAARGAFLPPYDTGATITRLEAVLARHQPARVICLGDSFHRPDSATTMEPDSARRLAALCAAHDWTWIGGNHDDGALPAAGGALQAELHLGGVTLRHEPRFAPGGPEIAGHLHPCARVVQRGRSLRRRCFAVCEGHLVLPAFGALTGSLNVLDAAFGRFATRPGARAAMIGRDGVHLVSAARLLPD